MDICFAFIRPHAAHAYTQSIPPTGVISTLEKLTDADLLNRGTILYKTVQILAYAHDLGVVAMEAPFLALGVESSNVNQ